MSDAGLIDAILADPEGYDARLLYADWLEERGDSRCEYLRLEVELAKSDAADPYGLSESPEVRGRLSERLLELAKEISTDWIARIAFYYDVSLERYFYNQRISTIKSVRYHWIIGLLNAKLAVDAVPDVVAHAVSRCAVEEKRRELHFPGSARQSLVELVQTEAGWNVAILRKFGTGMGLNHTVARALGIPVEQATVLLEEESPITMASNVGKETAQRWKRRLEGVSSWLTVRPTEFLPLRSRLPVLISIALEDLRRIQLLDRDPILRQDAGGQSLNRYLHNLQIEHTYHRFSMDESEPVPEYARWQVTITWDDSPFLKRVVWTDLQTPVWFEAYGNRYVFHLRHFPPENLASIFSNSAADVELYRK